jgi:hypothetical protein
MCEGTCYTVRSLSTMIGAAELLWPPDVPRHVHAGRSETCRPHTGVGRPPTWGLLLDLDARPFEKATARFSPAYDGRLIRAM